MGRTRERRCRVGPGPVARGRRGARHFARFALIASTPITAGHLTMADGVYAQEGVPPPGGIQERPDEGSLWASYGLAAGLGVLGFFAGGYAAIEATEDECVDLECLDTVFFGAAIAGTLGVAIGSHLGNGRRGNVALDILTAAGIWGLGIGPLFIADDADNAYATLMFIAVPIAQVVVTTLVERAVGRSKARARRERLQAAVVPAWTGDGAGVSLRLRF